MTYFVDFVLKIAFWPLTIFNRFKTERWKSNWSIFSVVNVVLIVVMSFTKDKLENGLQPVNYRREFSVIFHYAAHHQSTPSRQSRLLILKQRYLLLTKRRSIMQPVDLMILSFVKSQILLNWSVCRFSQILANFFCPNNEKCCSVCRFCWKKA